MQMMAEQVLDRPANMQELAARLIGLGYLPVPIPAGCKGPTIPGWQNLRITADEVPYYWQEPGMLVGCLHKNLACFDIDVQDPDLAAEIIAEGTRRFPGALERVGQAPKSALVLRLDEPGFRVTNTEKHSRTIDGHTYEAQVEVRTVTRQMVVYGIHPSTRQPYRWPRGELWSTPRESLPALTREEAQSFRDWCNERIQRWAGHSGLVIDLGTYRANTIATDEKLSEKAFLEALRHIPPSLGHEEGWRDVLMGIHDYFEGSYRGLEVAKDWSSPDPRYSAREVETKWASFETGKGVSFRTVLHMAKQYGCDLRALQAEDRKGYASAEGLNFDTGPDDDAHEEWGEQDAEPEKEKAAGPLEWFDDVEPTLTDGYLVKGVLSSGAMSVIYGPSNSGKTFFALDLAFHVATGTPWQGRRVNPAAVLYLAAEGGRGVANRIAALRIETGVCDVPMALRRAGLDLLKNSADLQHIVDLVKEVRARFPGMPILIVIDTLSRIMAGGDENSAQDMTALIRNIDAIREHTGSHIMLVHHTGKDAARGARGHSSLRAATDTEIEVQSEEGQRAAMVTKQRDYPGGETFAFSLKSVHLGVDQDGDEVTSCVVEWADSEEFFATRKATKGLGGNQKIIADTFDQMLAEGMGTPNPGGIGFPEAGRFMTVPLDQLRHYAQGKMVGSDTGKLFRQAWKALTEERGVFCVADKRVWRIDRRNGGNR